ncbi:MAG: polysaccharide deacetylase family protein [Candidatus Anstonellales archaeon]
MNICEKILQKGVFLISIDLEMMWGFNLELLENNRSIKSYLKLVLKSREAISYLLEILEKYEIPATWAVVGHLMLDRCEKVEGVPHPNMPRPKINGSDWYSLDPCSSVKDEPFWYAPDVIASILDSEITHEIASHSFSHVDFSRISAEVAEAELRESKKLIEDICGVTPKTFIFPKSRFGHFNILKTNGFIAFRGKSSIRDHKLTRYPFIDKVQNYIKIIINKNNSSLILLDQPKLEQCLWNIPGSLLFQESSWMNAYSLYKIATENIKKCLINKAIFHIILHDYSLVSSKSQKAFLKVIELVSSLKRKGIIEILTIGNLAMILSGYRDE